VNVEGFWDWDNGPAGSDIESTFSDMLTAAAAEKMSTPYDHVLEQVQERLSSLGLTAARLEQPSKQDEEALLALAMQMAQQYASAAASQSLPPLGRDPVDVAHQVLDDILGWGPLTDCMTDDTVEEIFINGPRHIYVVRAGQPKKRVDTRFRDGEHLWNFFFQKLDRSGGQRSITTKTPWLDGRLSDGSRFHGIRPPLVANWDNLVVTIRRFRPIARTLDEMVALGSMPVEVCRFLEAAVRARCNVVVAGGTASGKTTLLNGMGSALEPGERVVSIEDTPELQVPVEDWVQLVTREASEGVEGVSMCDLVRHALRMKPDRIWLGEARGPEMAAVLTAANTGHEGVMFTVHADNVRATLTRIETLVLQEEGMGNLPLWAIRYNIASALHLVVHLSRLRLPDGSEVRRITGIGEVNEQLQAEQIVVEDLWEWDSVIGALCWTQNYPSSALRERLMTRSGFDFKGEVHCE
jgi:pilus assembly protein CpaF